MVTCHLLLIIPFNDNFFSMRVSCFDEAMPSLLKIMQKIAIINSKSAFTIDYAHILYQS